MEKTKRELTSQEKMAQGSAWMMISNITSRLLGVIYIIPWYAWLGANAKTANGLFNMSYTIYSLFLTISTAGIPSAIAKQMAYYNSKNEYGVSQKLFVKALQIMGILGAVSAVVMFFGASWLAEASGGGAELIPSMRSLSVAVLVFPVMAVIRGYFQGNQDMMPYALSQIVEQAARVFYMLMATFIIMKVMKGDYLAAVTHSTLAAFIGMIGSLIVLVYYFQKQRAVLDDRVAHSANQLEVSATDLLIQTLKEAVPFIIVGAGITLFKIVDQVTFVRYMESITDFSHNQVVELYATFNANPDKLTMVVISLGTSLALTSLPLITESFALNKRKELAKMICDNFQLFAFVILPATIGMIVLAYPLNTLFYQPDKLGSLVLIEACFAGLFLGLYTLVSTMLQGLFENIATVQYLLIGLMVKIAVQIPAIRLAEVYGPLIATIIGLAVTCYLIIRKIYHVTRFGLTFTLKRCLLIFILTLVMGVAALLTRQVAYLVLDPNSRMQSFIIILLVAAVGIAVYGYLALQTGLAEKLLGESMVNRVKSKLRMK
ncbi:O-antigen/teichoic acid export membrane protein [Enterococcus sp. PF1-24]|uniref:putative polysaccharide biosynthesis protein n=1 Tax=unclassified Enterococcus TaxID=2608891 RepID=UPI00247584B2|nr:MULTISPECIES: polysaccharide biosynthesis protein [unclassified Enterococcus]MDH6363400.1 O-antigen/teichoic acid export membrane protein [Enterococcus sp. PFB1-1]MDH6400494.1 O-antigen/teichoic acid export membrane protein [Enterococcus sp. PF1-24]